MNCFECDKPAECEHHVVPRCLGGTKTVPLCLVCHGKIHGIDALGHKALQRMGIEKARQNGVYTGRQVGATKANRGRERAVKLQQSGRSTRQIAATLGVSPRTVCRYLS